MRQPNSLIGLPPDSGDVCIVTSHKSRAVVIRHLRKADAMKASFETPAELNAWVGAGTLKPVRTKDGLTLWLTDTMRRTRQDGTCWQEPIGKWVGYRWIQADPLVVAMFDAQLTDLIHEGAS